MIVDKTVQVCHIPQWLDFQPCRSKYIKSIIQYYKLCDLDYQLKWVDGLGNQIEVNDNYEK